MYNEQVLQGSIRPSLVDAFSDVAVSLDDKVQSTVSGYLIYTPQKYVR